MSLASKQALAALAPLDLHFARTVCRLGDESRDEVWLAAALASRQVREGHVCLDLFAAVADPRLTDSEGNAIEIVLPRAEHWCELLRTSPLVGDTEAVTPLVLDAKGRLYLRRYHEHERALAAALARRVEASKSAMPERHVDVSRLDRLFRDGVRGEDGVDWQRAAAVLALESRLAVISGGPGTGKTFTVVKVLALLIEQALMRGGVPPRIALAAPTGKAAARMNEAIRRAKHTLDCDDIVKQAIPETAATIHRLLGSIDGSSTRFRHDAAHRLAADVVLIDEASMVDLGLMRRLVDAVPENARLILLGDKDQLASVEAGAVLGDICNTGFQRSYSRPFAERWRQATGEALPLAANAPAEAGIWDCIVELKHSHRYQPGSGIHQLAVAINAGDSAAVARLLDQEAGGQVKRIAPQADGTPPPRWLRDFARCFESALKANEMDVDPRQRLRALGDCRVLCAHRRGPTGVETLNQRIEEQLAEAGWIDPSTTFYSGRPIIVTRNDYQVQLFNGDTGILLGADNGAVSAYFEGPEGEVRRLATARLPPHATVFAMSVHKSQGSEFDTVAVVLPQATSPVVSRELLYTAVTRAKSRVVICATHEAIAAAVTKPITRSSGLRDALWASS